jgi:hypothetical protein
MEEKKEKDHAFLVILKKARTRGCVEQLSPEDRDLIERIFIRNESRSAGDSRLSSPGSWPGCTPCRR